MSNPKRRLWTFLLFNIAGSFFTGMATVFSFSLLALFLSPQFEPLPNRNATDMVNLNGEVLMPVGGQHTRPQLE